jgi:hypothetical protein
MSVDTSGGHPDMDYGEHVRTYDGFVRAAQIIVGAAALVLILMAYFLL